jgi:hypothetical protein
LHRGRLLPSREGGLWFYPLSLWERVRVRESPSPLRGRVRERVKGW